MEQKKPSTGVVRNRLTFTLIAIGLQIIWSSGILTVVSMRHTVVYIVMRLFALFLILLIYWREGNSGFKMPWMILIMILPIFGAILFVLLGYPEFFGNTKQRFDRTGEKLIEHLPQDEDVRTKIHQTDNRSGQTAKYIHHWSSYPVWQNTEVTFFPDASEGLERQLAAMSAAEDFIFIEYHTFDNAIAFARIKEVLYERAAHGVEIRMLYDDVGSMFFLDQAFHDDMTAHGIECRVFNHLKPIPTPLINNRDHKKLTVIDGKVGFTGGYNLTDEYFNIKQPFGHWKDTGVELQGDAVRNLTFMFLQTWNVVNETDEDVSCYFPELPRTDNRPGYVQPYADTPLDKEPVGQNVYIQMLQRAERYIYFMTPYLILTDELHLELELAAKRGVDVRIITPGIPDKILVYQTTRSFYPRLIKAGVRIFEYTPGFCHGKQCVCDDKAAVVGSINLDYRSLYLHFEDAVFFCDCHAVADVKRDFEETFAECREAEIETPSPIMAIWTGILRLFSPMM